MRVNARSSRGPLERAADGAWHTHEGDEVTIEVEAAHPAEARISGARLQPATVSRRDARIVTTWRVPIHTWAGRSEIEIEDGVGAVTAALDVAPHPGKLGLDAFREMLHELAAVSRDLPWGLSPGALEAAESAASPAVVHPAVLEHELPVLVAAVAQLRRDPLTCTLRAREVDRLRQARHVDARSVRWLSTHPRALLATVAPTASSTADDALYIEQRRTTQSLAHPATAHIRFLVERLLRLLARSATQLGALAKEASSEDREHATWLKARIERACADLALELSRTPLCLVEPTPASEGAAQVIVDHPVYGRIQRVARRLLDPGVEISGDAAIRASVRRTHELYELLVLFRFVQATRKHLGPDWIWASPDVVRTGAIDVLPDDSAFIARGPRGFRIEIHYQSTFASYGKTGAQKSRHTLSGERRPDTVVGLFEGETLRRWLILDAKYRASRSAIHDGLADVHVYRDALRWLGKPASASFIAIPACEDDARIYSDESYLREHRFGALVTSDPACFALPLWLLAEGAGLDPSPTRSFGSAGSSAHSWSLRDRG